MSTPKVDSDKSKSAKGMMTMSIPKGSALVFRTEIVCGKTLSETKNRFARTDLFFLFFTPKKSVIASAAAVPSSSKEALATGKPVKSQTIV